MQGEHEQTLAATILRHFKVNYTVVNYVIHGRCTRQEEGGLVAFKRFLGLPG